MKRLLVIAVCAGLFGAGLAESREIKVHQKFAGAGTETGVDTNGDMNFAFAIALEHRGSPGKSTSTHSSEFTDFVFGDCPGPIDVPTAHLVQHRIVQTFSDLSTLNLVATRGFICFNPVTSEVTCEEEGTFVGGTGRFEGATGSWTVSCEIFPLETVNAMTGTIKGTVQVPGKSHK